MSGLRVRLERGRESGVRSLLLSPVRGVSGSGHLEVSVMSYEILCLSGCMSSEVLPNETMKRRLILSLCPLPFFYLGDPITTGSSNSHSIRYTSSCLEISLPRTGPSLWLVHHLRDLRSASLALQRDGGWIVTNPTLWMTFVSNNESKQPSP